MTDNPETLACLALADFYNEQIIMEQEQSTTRIANIKIDKYLYSQYGQDEYYKDEALNDAKKIVLAFKKFGIVLSVTEAAVLWSIHSDDLCASYLSLPDDAETIYRLLKEYIEI